MAMDRQHFRWLGLFEVNDGVEKMAKLPAFLGALCAILAIGSSAFAQPQIVNPDAGY